MVIALKIPYLWWKKQAKIFNIIVIVLLMLVLILGVKINGAR